MFSKAKPADTPAADPALAEDPLVAQARTQARRRLIGAVVLLAAGVAAFPLVFDTRPRALTQDLRVVVPASASAPSSAATVAISAPRPIVGTAGAAGGGRELTPASLPEDAGIEAPRPASAAASATRPAPAASAASTSKPEAKPASRPEPKPEPRPEPSAPPRPVTAAAPPAAASGPANPAAQRFVVQAGAYSDAASLRSARQKVEALGMKTYTQDIDNSQGKRTRVRVGPFASRDEAEAAARRIKGTGLQANVITL